ncbi:alpha/beta hydrolase [Aquipseudomonas ullengensis]|uniref:Alpha/beta hydrolase n=1 Tax=Aquipseudomonas ullengensis TaxID=2759166 RepID=A0A7W4QC55_9GAMM|nr:alpha/beta hydrolase [Pseudomonas ullengensis]MBB2494596.1 alpha/beta hydrolase [Pseudomonas ullengensis]
MRLALPCFALPLCLGLLTACAGHPEPPTNPADAMQPYLQAAYQPAAHVPVTGWDALWMLGEEAVEVSWLAPREAQGAPLIVYLPGLGEGSRAGEQWRRAWAEAGYAVLSVQPKRYGRAIYSSNEAQAGVFYGLAQRSYAASALQGRIEVLEQVLGEVRRRAQAGEFAGVELKPVAVAGFDLGAQTAAALAGERDAREPMPAGWQPQAVILLSPYAPSQADPQRFARIATSVLAVTGPRDEDPFSWVSPPSRRQQLWQGLQVAGSYQLLSRSASHALLSGSLAGMPPGEGRGGKPPRGSEGGGPGGSGAGGPGGGGPGGPGGPGRGGEVFASRAGHGQGVEETFDPRQAASVQAVSLAFLDARVRHSAAAQAWLDQAAEQWLQPVASLQRKP